MDVIGLIPSFGNLFYTIAAFVVALSVIVAVHEYGHYIVGRWSGIKAEVFSIGFGPRIYSRIDKHGTRWQIALFPLGGYVKFLGDASAASDKADEEVMSHLTDEERRHTMHGAPLWARAATVAAGPIFNFILSMVVFASFFMISGIATDTPTIGKVNAMPGGSGGLLVNDTIVAVDGTETPDFEALGQLIEDQPSSPTATYLIEREGEQLTVEGPTLYPSRIANVTPGSAAMDVGLMRGDVLIAADGQPLYTFGDLQKVVTAAAGTPILMEVWREAAEPFSVALTARVTDTPKRGGGFETRYLIGISGDYVFEPAVRTASPLEAMTGAASQTWFVASSSVSGIWHIVTGAISKCNLGGPIRIAEMSSAAASLGISDFIWFLAVLSTAVGLLNLFPIPVLDGGHLVFHAWEAIAGKPPPDAVLRVLMTIGLAIVLGVMVFGLTNDLFCP